MTAASCRRNRRPGGRSGLADNGILFIGERERCFAAVGRARRGSFRPAGGRNFNCPPKTIPRSIGHRAEWIQACKDKKPEDAKAGFAYSGPFTEALLVGNLAARLQQRIEWDAANVRQNAPEAEA